MVWFFFFFFKHTVLVNNHWLNNWVFYCLHFNDDTVVDQSAWTIDSDSETFWVWVGTIGDALETDRGNYSVHYRLGNTAIITVLFLGEGQQWVQRKWDDEGRATMCRNVKDKQRLEGAVSRWRQAWMKTKTSRRSGHTSSWASYCVLHRSLVEEIKGNDTVSQDIWGWETRDHYPGPDLDQRKVYFFDNFSVVTE